MINGINITYPQPINVTLSSSAMVFLLSPPAVSSCRIQDEILHVPVQKHVHVPMVTKVPRTVEVEQAGSAGHVGGGWRDHF